MNFSLFAKKVSCILLHIYYFSSIKTFVNKVNDWLIKIFSFLIGELILILGNGTIAPRIIAPGDNCPSDNCPPKIAIPEIIPQIISPWTIGAQSIAKQNNWLLICTPKNCHLKIAPRKWIPPGKCLLPPKTIASQTISLHNYSDDN